MLRAIAMDVGPLRRHAQLRLLFTAQVSSGFGSFMTRVAVPYEVYRLTHSTFLVGVVGMPTVLTAACFVNVHLKYLLPIPALDGGHAMFLLIEMVKGKPLSDKFLERAQLVGFVILISLMVFVFGNDITRLFKK